MVRATTIGAAVVVLAGAVALAGLRVTHADRIYPGVSVAGIDLGGLDRHAADAALRARAEALERGFVTFSYEDQIWSPTLTELGVTVDVDATLAAAYAIGRDGSARGRLVATSRLLRRDTSVPLSILVDRTALDRWFAEVDQALGRPALDAELAIAGKEVSILPDADGLVVDRPVATEALLAALRGLTPLNRSLPVVAQPPAVRAAELTDARNRLAVALARPVPVEFERRSWELAPEEIGRFVIWTVDPSKRGAEKVSIALDEARLARWLSERLGPEINRDPVDARVAWSNERGGLIALEPSVDGVKLKPKTFARAVAASFFGDHAPVDVPVAITKPQVDSANLAALGITTRLAVGDSNYVGSSEGRATNIEVGTRLLNGTLVPPGGEFSFNHAVGVISEEAGFVEAKVINGERFDLDIGGGICQVSTTVFRAALYAGLPITEWWPHLYQPGFYEQDGWAPGFDASILQPEGDPFGGGDFRFANPSDSWLLVEAWADGERIFIIIYGPELGYTVEISKPEISAPIPATEDLEIVDPELPTRTVEQTELAQPGLVVSYTRTVTGRDGAQVLQDTWTTRYQPKGNVWKVSPDMKGKSPAGHPDR